jgi:hypothetical protein
MMSQPFRITPNLPAEAYTTYQLIAPQSDGLPATCAAVECEHWRNGWSTTVPKLSAAADYIRRGAGGRRFTEKPSDQIGYARFVFPPGQSCFESGSHRTPLAVIRGGDWRARTSETMRVGLPEWVERFALNQQKIKDTHDKGAL